MNLFLLILLSYLIGSIPFSYLFSKLKGRDPRRAGTGNVGASNVLVVAGPPAAGLSMVGDIAKGIMAIQLARYFNLSDGGIALCGLAAIAGHDFSIFLRFSGGKGVATTGGVLLALGPLFSVLVVLLWIITAIVIRHFIPSTMLIMAFLPAMMWMTSWRKEYIFFAIGAFLLAVYAHRMDLRRYFAGEEITIQETLAKYRKK